MYTNEELQIIKDNQHYVGLDGTQWVNTDKSTIKELIKVTESPRPTGDVVVTGFHIDKTYTQVWDYRDKTQEELANEKKQSLQNEIISLEAQVTPRRRDEAMLSGDYSFIADIRKQIDMKREELKGL